jgi:1-acyl-sn-glycerol-3-phosphate acyltransferase
MNKSESKELADASKRPSARRAASDSDLPAAESADKTAKRVHARRPTPTYEREPARTDQDGTPPDAPELALGIELELASSVQTESGDLSKSRAAAAADGIGFGADGQESPAVEPVLSNASPAPRARARRPRASQTQSHATARSAYSPAATPAPGLTHSQPTAAEEPSRHSDVSELVPASAAADALEASGNHAARLRAARDFADDYSPPSLDHADFADDFGLDPEYESKLRPWLDSLCERHFHVELRGAENIPAHGRAMLVANHSRANVWDGIVLRAALRAQHPVGRMPRWLVDDQQFHAPFLGTIVNRLGAVRACQENAERLLLREELVAVFPEGSKATERPYEERYRLQRIGRGGYIKLALRTGTPVIPVAIVAREFEGAVWRNRLANASRLLAAPLAVLRPGLPRLGTLGKLGMPPISARIRIYVGAPIAEISRQDASATRDDGLVHELNECVRSAVQHLVNSGLHA